VNHSRHHMPCILENVDGLVMSLIAELRDVLSPKALSRVRICATEALTNIVKHARPAATGHVIEAALHMYPDDVTLEIFDLCGAATFDPRDFATDLSELDPLSESGRGLGLILHYADMVEYGPVNGRNRLSLRFQKEPEE